MLYITGDTHRDFNRLFRFCDRIRPSKNDAMIILGDAGFNYYGGWRDVFAKSSVSNLPIMAVTMSTPNCFTYKLCTPYKWNYERGSKGGTD